MTLTRSILFARHRFQMSGYDKLNSKADPTITLIVGNSITRDVILLCATNCVLHETTTRHTTAWAYIETHKEKRSRTSDDFLWSLALKPRAFGSSHASTHNLLMTTTLPHDLWWYKSNKKPTLVTFTAALPWPARYPIFTAYWERARLFVVYMIQTQPRTTAIRSMMPYIFASVRRFMTGQVVPDFDQSRFRLTHSLLFLFCLILLNPFKEHVSIYYPRASPE